MEEMIIIEPNVELLGYTHNPELTVAQAATLCYSKTGLNKNLSLEEARKVIERIPKKHKSILEHAVYRFYIEGISRACSHQIVRHRIASYSQRSQRYVNETNGSFVFPKKLVEIMGEDWINEQLEPSKAAYKKILQVYSEKGIKGEEAHEDARYLLPNASETKMILSINASSLLNFLNARMCNRAQKEIRTVAYEMYSLVYPTAPSIFEHAGPDCLTIGCQEGRKCCGKAKEVKYNIENIKEKIK